MYPSAHYINIMSLHNGSQGQPLTLHEIQWNLEWWLRTSVTVAVFHAVIRFLLVKVAVVNIIVVLWDDYAISLVGSDLLDNGAR